MEKIVIIGGVAAGATAAAKARRLSADAEITILEAGADISFANCGLPYYIGGDIKNRSKLILQSPGSFKEQYNVDVHIHTLATRIDTKAKVIYTENSETGEKKNFDYTKLILAQGGKPIAPPLPGADGDHVFQLWTLADMDKIDAFITDKAPQTAVVVGGGFIGLEMTEALVKRGMKVSVVEMMPHVMGIMEAETAGFIEEELLAYGVNLYTGKAVASIGQNDVTLKDGTKVSADMVLLSIGVRPTLNLAKETGLQIGEAGGILVDNTLKTSDDNIYAAGDMVELEHRVLGKKVRIPLAGPANRQGRLAAENAMGHHHEYKGAIGTSIVRVFEAVAGTTGLSLKQARAEGFDADAILVHKENHTSYYPGAQMVDVQLVYDRQTGIILGGQTSGYEGADRRLDVIATAVAAKLKVSDIGDMDFAYSPPLGNANDAMNMAAYVAENRMSGFSPALTTSELDAFLKDYEVVWLDVRDVFSFDKAHVEGAINMPLEVLSERLSELDKDKTILVYDQTGKKGHQALRTLLGAGFKSVINVSGGFMSLAHFVRAINPENFELQLPEPEAKTLGDSENQGGSSNSNEGESQVVEEVVKEEGPIVIDVRTPDEYDYGAYPGSVNIPLDEIESRLDEIGSKDREITLYCASGARSAYALQILNAHGFTKATNGGGIARMMSRYRA